LITSDVNQAEFMCNKEHCVVNYYLTEPLLFS
jgi:hypothetical protein